MIYVDNNEKNKKELLKHLAVQIGSVQDAWCFHVKQVITYVRAHPCMLEKIFLVTQTWKRISLPQGSGVFNFVMDAYSIKHLF